MTQLQQAIQNHDTNTIGELAAKYSLIAIVAVGIASCFIGLL
ncbi:hypothetical protein [Zhongshania sp. BJYM1]|jgi:hypothetical protein|nr:hypothetical protein [Marortus sp. BJYM1]